MKEKQTVPFSHQVGALLLVTGACIGGGMLALPVDVGVSGFIPSLAIMAICWAFMTCTGLLIVEANLWMEEGAHVMTMATRFLGLPGKIISAILFLFMGYGSLIAYNAAGAELIMSTLRGLLGYEVAYWEGCIIFAAIFGLMLYLGTHVIGRINSLLVIGMIIAYFFMTGLGFPEVDHSLLAERNWGKGFFAIPLVIATFSYQMIVPSLTPYLKRNPEAMRRCVFWGTTIPFIVYGVWQAIVLGIVPLEGTYGLNAALAGGKPATWSLRHFVESPVLAYSADFFGFFALVTSYLAIALGTYDFISDSARIPNVGFGKIVLGLIVVIPTLLFSIKYSNAFITALSITGGFGDSILNGLIPVSMVWIGRYRLRIEGPYTVGGGKLLLTFLATFAGIIITYQILDLI